MADRYFILTDLPDVNEAIEKVQNAGIEILVCELEDPYPPGYGIILREDDFEKVCSLCGINQRTYSLLETDRENTFIVKFELDIDPNDPRSSLRLTYAKLVMGRLKGIGSEIETKVNNLKQRIDQLTQEIHTLSRDLFEEQAKQRHLQNFMLEVTNQLLEDFSRLSKMPEVESIEINDGVLSVMTKPIVAKSADAQVNLGSYRIDISPQAESPKFYPTSDRQIRRIGGTNYIHPSIPADNKFHLSRFMPTFAQLMGEWNFSQVIVLAINILKNVDPKSKLLLRWWEK